MRHRIDKPSFSQNAFDGGARLVAKMHVPALEVKPCALEARRETGAIERVNPQLSARFQHARELPHHGGRLGQCLEDSKAQYTVGASTRERKHPRITGAKVQIGRSPPSRLDQRQLRVVESNDVQALFGEPPRVGAGTASDVEIRRPPGDALPEPTKEAESRVQPARRPAGDARVVV